MRVPRLRRLPAPLLLRVLQLLVFFFFVVVFRVGVLAARHRRGVPCAVVVLHLRALSLIIINDLWARRLDRRAQQQAHRKVDLLEALEAAEIVWVVTEHAEQVRLLALQPADSNRIERG